MTPPVSSLIHELIAHGVVSDSDVQALLFRQRRLPGTSRPILTDTLLAEGLLTAFQAASIKSGHIAELRLGQYLLEDRIGSGGMGQVYLARHVKLPKQVAIKVLPQEHSPDPLAVARFIREAKTCGSIAHPNIVAVYDVEMTSTPPYIIMEFVPGVDLHSAVVRSGRFAVGEAAACGVMAANGLQRASELGLVHRDIKPANLIVNKTGDVKILDFGLARKAILADGESELTSTGTQNRAILGTVDYLAPEQAINSSTVDIRADIYSLGATLYFLLAGQPPFAGGTKMGTLLRKQMADPSPIHLLRPNVPPHFSSALQTAMARDPRARFQTPAEFATALAPFVGLGPDFPSRLFALRHSKAATQDTFPAECSVSGLASTVANTTSPAPESSSGRKNWMATVEEVETVNAERPSRSHGGLGWLWVTCGGLAVMIAGGWLCIQLLLPAAPVRQTEDVPQVRQSRQGDVSRPIGNGVDHFGLGPLDNGLKDGSFEMPMLTTNNGVFNPTGSPWTFGPNSGLVAPGPANPTKVPLGKQVLVLKHDGVVSQSVVLTGGTYHATFVAAQPHPNAQWFRVSLGDHTFGPFTPVKEFTAFTTPSMNLKGGTYDVRIQGLNTRGWDNTGYVDDFRLVRE